MEVESKKVYRFARLSPEREAKITELEEVMKRNFDPLPLQLVRTEHSFPTKLDSATTLNTSRLYCYLFLSAREWNVQKAFAMMQQSVAYRKEYHLDVRGEFPAAIPVRGWDTADVAKSMNFPPRDVGDSVGRVAAASRAFVEMGFHYWDRRGLPIFYIMLGKVNARGWYKKMHQMAKIGETRLDVYWRLVQHVMGVGEGLVMYQQQRYDNGDLDIDGSEGRLCSCNIVLDMKGFTFRLIWKPVIDLLRGALSRLFQYYPDYVHRIWVVNCPPTVMFAYNLIKPVLPTSMERKITFVSPSDTLGALSLLMDPAYIPERYGGVCRCEGGCFSAHDSDDVLNVDDSESEGGDIIKENITITAGTDYCRVFPLVEEDTVVWEYVAKKCNGVTFTVYFVPAEKAAAMQWGTVSAKELEPHVVSKDHPLSAADTFVAKEKGTLVLMWANRKSWFTSKFIQLHIYKEAGMPDNG